jgi:hypothetical protein
VFNSLTKKDLLDIIHSNDLDELIQIWHKKKYTRMIARARSKVILEDTHIGDRSAIPAINLSTTPINLWWLFSGIFIPLLGINALLTTLIFFGLGIFSGVAYLCYIYDNRTHKQEKFIASIQLARLQDEALDTLIQYKTEEIIQLDPSYTPKEITHKQSESSNKNHHVSKMKSFWIGTGVAAALTISYVYGISAILETLEVITIVGALSGPIGIAIAAASMLIAIGIGVYLGYKHYQGQVAISQNKSQKETLDNSIAHKKTHYQKLKSKHQQLIFTQKLESSIDAQIRKNNIMHTSDEKADSTTGLLQKTSFGTSGIFQHSGLLTTSTPSVTSETSRTIDITQNRIP